jgi:hypothetical protein
MQRTARLLRSGFLITALCVAAHAPRAAAVDEQEIKVDARWSVVGIIAGGEEAGKPVGIAVLKNNATKHTYTLSIGDAVPNEFGYTLQSVKGRAVVITDGKQKVSLSFAEGSSEDDSSPQSRTARFIDNYYRGFGEAPPVDIFSSSGSGGTASEDGSSQPLRLPLNRFGTLREDAARSRFESYHDNRGYRDDEPETATDPSEYVVNYDSNYDEVPPESGYDAAPLYPDAPEAYDREVGQALDSYDAE